MGSSKDADSQLDNIKDLLQIINDFLENSEKMLQISFTGDGAIIWFKKDSLLPLQLAIKIHEKFPPCSEKQNFGLKIGIARNTAIEIESAKSILGIPVWGNGPTFARRLCDLCDDSHILLDSNVYEFFTKNYKKETSESFCFKISNSRFFQDLGEFFVKHEIPNMENHIYQQNEQDQQYQQALQKEINEFVVNLRNHFSEEEQIVFPLALKANLR